MLYLSRGRGSYIHAPTPTDAQSKSVKDRLLLVFFNISARQVQLVIGQAVISSDLRNFLTTYVIVP